MSQPGRVGESDRGLRVTREASVSTPGWRGGKLGEVCYRRVTGRGPGGLGGSGDMYFTGKLRLYAAAVVMLLVPCMPVQSAPPSCVVPAPSLNVDDIPIDVCGPYFDFDAFGNMAWETFKTLVWPVSMTRGVPDRGVPDKSRKITDKDQLLVFETYKADWETFLGSKDRPVDWHDYTRTAPVCANAATMTPPLDERSLVLAARHKFQNLDQRDIDPKGEYKDIVHVLVAQNGSLVRYLTAFGEKAYNAILNNELYNPIDLPLFSDEAPTERTKVKPGTITIKTAWIELDENIPDHNRFYFREAWLQKPFEGTCHLTRVGLVGFHIAHKTEQSPQWLWASFEHVGNVPRLGEKRKTTFNDGAGTIEDHPPESAWVPIDKIPPPYNVARVREIPEAIGRVNERWHQMLSAPEVKSVWANYELVAVQWPRNRKEEARKGVGRDGIGWSGAYPSPPCSFGEDLNVSNSVIETFLQPHTKCPKDLTCMSCHNRVRNYDFIWSIPIAHNKGPAGGTSSTSRKVLSTLQELIGQTKQ